MMNVNNDCEQVGSNTTRGFSSSAMTNSSVPFSLQNRYTSNVREGDLKF